MSSYSIGIIGGADGPTSIFLSSTFGWINTFGVIFMAAILIPNFFYYLRYPNAGISCPNRVLNALEQLGRYACMLLMVLNIGVSEYGISSFGNFFIYLAGNTILILLYWIVWGFYFHRRTLLRAAALALLPAAVFLLSGLTLNHPLLTAAAILFGVAHFLVTCQNY